MNRIVKKRSKTLDLGPKHQYKTIRINQSIVCDFCTQQLWGEIRTAIRCSECDLVCHKGCTEVEKSNEPCKATFIDLKDMPLTGQMKHKRSLSNLVKKNKFFNKDKPLLRLDDELELTDKYSYASEIALKTKSNPLDSQVEMLLTPVHSPKKLISFDDMEIDDLYIYKINAHHGDKEFDTIGEGTSKANELISLNTNSIHSSLIRDDDLAKMIDTFKSLEEPNLEIFQLDFQTSKEPSKSNTFEDIKELDFSLPNNTLEVSINDKRMSDDIPLFELVKEFKEIEHKNEQLQQREIHRIISQGELISKEDLKKNELDQPIEIALSPLEDLKNNDNTISDQLPVVENVMSLKELHRKASLDQIENLDLIADIQQSVEVKNLELSEITTPLILSKVQASTLELNEIIDEISSFEEIKGKQKSITIELNKIEELEIENNLTPGEDNLSKENTPKKDFFNPTQFEMIIEDVACIGKQSFYGDLIDSKSQRSAQSRNLASPRSLVDVELENDLTPKLTPLAPSFTESREDSWNEVLYEVEDNKDEPSLLQELERMNSENSIQVKHKFMEDLEYKEESTPIVEKQIETFIEENVFSLGESNTYFEDELTINTNLWDYRVEEEGESFSNFKGFDLFDQLDSEIEELKINTNLEEFRFEDENFYTNFKGTDLFNQMDYFDLRINTNLGDFDIEKDSFVSTLQAADLFEQLELQNKLELRINTNLAEFQIEEENFVSNFEGLDIFDQLDSQQVDLNIQDENQINIQNLNNVYHNNTNDIPAKYEDNDIPAKYEDAVHKKHGYLIDRKAANQDSIVEKVFVPDLTKQKSYSSLQDSHFDELIEETLEDDMEIEDLEDIEEVIEESSTPKVDYNPIDINLESYREGLNVEHISRRYSKEDLDIDQFDLELNEDEDSGMESEADEDLKPAKPYMNLPSIEPTGKQIDINKELNYETKLNQQINLGSDVSLESRLPYNFESALYGLTTVRTLSINFVELIYWKSPMKTSALMVSIISSMHNLNLSFMVFSALMASYYSVGMLAFLMDEEESPESPLNELNKNYSFLESMFNLFCKLNINLDINSMNYYGLASVPLICLFLALPIQTIFNYLVILSSLLIILNHPSILMLFSWILDYYQEQQNKVLLSPKISFNFDNEQYVCENQRWSILGWNSNLYSEDPAQFTTLDSSSSDSPSHFKPPKNKKWTSEWTLVDCFGAGDGWVYSDFQWKNQSSKMINSFTRKRVLKRTFI